MKEKCSIGMYAEHHALACREPAEVHVSLVRLDKGGYGRGRYFGVCQPGERIHQVSTEYGGTCVRSSSTSRDIV